MKKWYVIYNKELDFIDEVYCTEDELKKLFNLDEVIVEVKEK